ncbi:hypothetical protein PHYBLDRAFT_147932 [Phycomyces blakesleeanus NRRL 1555(-)]|uniref:DH domain-containing protein n=1 Tax=Phycomyces blakesleeanus (strain ATCC 8743b / DSM 1359 / FGSC 10004 / NBRC 33097 / NRRL 1555) TaxID=763407 RepID=A0A162WXU4_PHYB8|nr:hypothetical protein PHYBLDRAFT_147932 [Phycomyces blakesleeanus NRRL 1555(-)]OAD71435.1 hypothetical protein PHYBLDRAFT_147932 [Phycomyces blakesleeanus NRRL 1555(-)]|eukprot:XP_018289475.1 hypothetical protein PHYBLDRAFT_147932 [Phycomyces blakesleeanus NRRL 1555(-)]
MGKFPDLTFPSSLPNDPNQTDAEAIKKTQPQKIVKRAGVYLHRKLGLFCSKPPQHSIKKMCSNVSSGRISVYTLPTSIEDEVAARKEFLRRPTDDTHESLYKGFKPNGFGTPCSYKTWKESINPKQYQQLSRLSPKQQKYQELIHEVILTECKYIEDLELVQKIFIKDAVEWEGLPSTLLKIFNSTNKIVELHKSILKDFLCRQAKEHPEIRTIGDIFDGYVDSMEIYSTYFVNFEQANHVITNALKSKSDLLGTYIRNRASWSECRNLPLQSFMLLPIQRIMKYPLFFRQLRECLEPEDSIFWEMQQLETKMDKAIRLIENDKAEAERYHRLEDLTTRISGLDPGRRLIHEGPLDLLPCSQNPLTDSSNDIYGSSISFNPCGSVQSLYVHRPYLQRQSSAQSITSPHPNVLKRRNSTFSIKEKKKHLYVFLFDDLIICTKIRSTSREIDENIIAKVESYHGPNPEALFRVVQEPGQLTLVDRTVTRKVARQDKTGRLLGSLRKPTAAAFNAMYNSTTEYEEHPLQFMCSIASKRIVVYHFEAPTAHDKDVWCTRLQEASKLHVRSPDTVQHDPTKDTTELKGGCSILGASINYTDRHTENNNTQHYLSDEQDELKDVVVQAQYSPENNDESSDDYTATSYSEDQPRNEDTAEQTLASALREASQELSRISLESTSKTEHMDFVMDFAVDLDDNMGPKFKVSDFDKYVFNHSHERFSVPIILEEKDEPMEVKYYTLKSPRVGRFPQTFKI